MEPSPNEANRLPIQSDDAPRLPFSSLAVRGFAAGNRAILGALLLFLLLAPNQIGGNLSAVLLLETGGMQVQPGKEPPPEAFMMIGVGCFICTWLPLVVFGMPWVMGGILGIVRGAVIGDPVDKFPSNAKRYYVRLLLLVLLAIVASLAIYLPITFAGSLISAQQQVDLAAGFTPERLQDSSRNPVNLAFGYVAMMAFAGVGVILNLTQASIALENAELMTAIGKAFRFCQRNVADTCKLYVIAAIISFPTVFLQQAMAMFGLFTYGSALGLAVLFSAYLSYSSVINSGIGVSLYHGRVADDKCELPAS
ncbi:MAG: hypothetical protein R3C99_24040 [Pirellulaceae bacterium]